MVKVILADIGLVPWQAVKEGLIVQMVTYLELPFGSKRFVVDSVYRPFSPSCHYFYVLVSVRNGLINLFAMRK